MINPPKGREMVSEETFYLGRRAYWRLAHAKHLQLRRRAPNWQRGCPILSEYSRRVKFELKIGDARAPASEGEEVSVVDSRRAAWGEEMVAVQIQLCEFWEGNRDPLELIGRDPDAVTEAYNKGLELVKPKERGHVYREAGIHIHRLGPRVL